jgi:protein-L-isoaspartate(D-aspartate) O-methyltransferase
MVRYQIAGRGVADPAVLSAMRKVPRHEFVPAALRGLSYEDFPLPISEGQTISQPYIVALMSELARIKKTDRVLEIGAGSGYQAAVLGELAKEVYTMEIVDPLARAARETLQRLGYANVFVKSGDGYRGWPEHAPFDAVIVTAAPEKIPQHLVEQLKTGGRMVLPLGSWSQELIVVTKEKDGVRTRSVIPVRFVPMTGEVEGSKR